MIDDFFEVRGGEGPLITAAIHDGSKLREDLRPLMNLTKDERLREEDPFTAHWLDIADTFIKGNYSRFEVDLNRSRDQAIYRVPADAWGLNVWKGTLNESHIEKSLEKYDAFYATLKNLLDYKIDKYGGFIMYDFHSYNHLRDGQGNAPADPVLNPEINIGTGNMERKKWNPVIEAFMNKLRSFDYLGRNLDVRENVKFKGGYFSRWIHENYPGKSCVIAIEVKKFFMDEWSGIPDHTQLNLLKKAFESTIPEVLAAFQSVSDLKSVYGKNN